MENQNEIQTREALLRDIAKDVQTRAFLIKREAINVDARTVELAFSSETLVERSWGWELLDHSPGCCDLSIINDSAPLIVGHDFEQLVGVVESGRIDSDRVGRAITRFGRSEDAEEIFQDVIDGIRKHVSVGYRINNAVHDGDKDGMPIVRITDWQPYEITLTPIPADRRVGIGRSAEQPIPPAAPVVQPATEPVTRKAPMTTESIDVTAIEKRGAQAAMAAVQEINKLGEEYAAHGGREVASRAISEGRDAKWATDEILRSMVSKAQASPSGPDLGMTGKEVRGYSILRALQAQMTGNWKDAGLEREAHEALIARGIEAKNGGILIPYEIQKRDMSTGANGGNYLVATDNLGGSFIDLLRNRTVLGQLGATMLPGLKGNVTIPKQTAAGTAYWLSAETTQITESNQTIGQLAMSPKNVGAYTEISRQLMMQSSPAADMLVMNDLARVIALAIDIAGFEGNGSGAPVGIANTASIGSVTGTSLAYAGMLEFQSDVATANALTAGCAYVTTPAVAALLAARARFSSTDTPLWQGNLLDGSVVGYKGMTTNVLTAASMIFGDFSQVIIGEWGTLELAVSPYADFKAGISGVRAFQTVDIGIRHAGAFSRATSIT